MILKGIGPLLMLLLLSSCATFQSYQVCDIHNDTGLAILHPVAFNASLISNQQVTITTVDDKFEFLSQLEVTQDRLVLVALTPIGHKLFQIEYRRQLLQFERFGIPDSFNPAYLLADVSLIYGDSQVLEQCYQQAGIPKPKINDYDSRRVVLYPGLDAITISYTAEKKWSGDIVFTNPNRNYTIEIRSLGVEQL